MNGALTGDGLGDVILPTSSLGDTLKALRKKTLSISNRLRSITDDADFVELVADSYGLPLVANERCGAWYVRPEMLAESVYFKSTDGHFGQWNFSVRRLNIQLLDVLIERGGCVIVDSTRRGKVMPDAFSKTVPIWCAVINAALFPGSLEAGRLHTPSRSVSDSEHDQISALIPGFGSRFLDLGFDLSHYRDKITKPLRPVWVTQGSFVPEERPSYKDYHPIVLCTASLFMPAGDVAADGYIQGAGDDNENWSRGLSPQAFWNNHAKLTAAHEAELPSLIFEITQQRNAQPNANSDRFFKISPRYEVHTGSEDLLHNQESVRFDTVVHCSLQPHLDTEARLKTRYHHLRCRPGKNGSRDLRQALRRLPESLSAVEQSGNMLLCAPDSSDLAVGVGLYILCLLESGRIQGSFEDQKDGIFSSKVVLNKMFVQQQLATMYESKGTRLSRATLLAVNDALLSTDATGTKANTS